MNFRHHDCGEQEFIAGADAVHRSFAEGLYGRSVQLKDLALPAQLEDPARHAFLEGVKAAFIVSQKNRLGQVLCARCGRGWDTVPAAVAAMGLCSVYEDPRSRGYDSRLGWGNDDPNLLLLCCLRCMDDARPS